MPSPRVAVALCAILAAFAAAGRADAQDRRNAATWYQEAFDAYQSIAREEMYYIGSWDRWHPPTPEVRRILDDLEPAFDLALRGAECRNCDWDLNYDDGMGLLLPHLAQMRNVARGLASRASVAVQDGRTRDAIRDYEALAAIAEHAATDDVLISSLVSLAIANLMANEVEHWMRVGRLDATDVTALRDEISTLSRVGAYRTLPALANERATFVPWLEREFAGTDEAGRREFLGDLGMGGDDDNPLLEIGDAELPEMLAGLDEAYVDAIDVVEVAFEDPELGDEAMAAWEAELIDGAYGEMARQLVPAFTRVVAATRRGANEVAKLNDALNAAAADPSAILTDASAHYRVALEIAADLDPEPRATLESGRIPMDPVPVDDAEAMRTRDRLLAALEGRSRMIDALSRGAACETFRPESMGEEGDSLILPAWGGHLRVAFRVVEGAAIEAERTGDERAARELRALIVRVVTHVGSVGVEDEGTVPVGPILVAVEALERVIERTADAGDAGDAGDAVDAGAGGANDDGRGPLVDPVASALAALDEVPGALGLRAVRGALTMHGSQAVHDLRVRVAGGTPGWYMDAELLRELDLDARVALVLALERVAGGMFGGAAPPSSRQIAAVERERRDAADRGEDPESVVPAERRIFVPGGYGEIIDRDRVAALEGRIPDLRRAVALDGASPDAVFGELAPLELRSWISRASIALADARLRTSSPSDQG